MMVTLPLPDKKLSPNARCHWAAKARAVKSYRLVAMAMGWKLGKLGLESATLQCVFFLKGGRGRKPDPDNLLASMKSAFDGLVDAEVFLGDQKLKHLPVIIDEDPENPRVEIHINT